MTPKPRVVLEIGRFKTGQIVDLADVRRGVLKNDGHSSTRSLSNDQDIAQYDAASSIQPSFLTPGQWVWNR